MFDIEDYDKELIECSNCGKVLNGSSLWVSDEKIYCEECYDVKK